MPLDVSYFSLASIAALGVFILVIIPRSLWHLASVGVRLVARRPAGADLWLVLIGAAALVCGGLGWVMAAHTDRAERLLNASAAATFAFLFFATPAVLQVMRAWANGHREKITARGRLMVLLAVLSLPASMAIPTAALMRAAAAAGPDAAPIPADNPAAGLADARFFTDSEIANDPEDYPAARWLEQTLSWRAPPPGGAKEVTSFVREVPTFTAFWFDQTTNMLSFDAADAFGVLISPITHVRANVGFSLMVWAYKLLCALILVAVTFDAFLRPLADRIRRHPG
jgi:hypothetical protein